MLFISIGINLKLEPQYIRTSSHVKTSVFTYPGFCLVIWYMCNLKIVLTCCVFFLLLLLFLILTWRQIHSQVVVAVILSLWKLLIITGRKRKCERGFSGLCFLLVAFFIIIFLCLLIKKFLLAGLKAWR